MPALKRLSARTFDHLSALQAAVRKLAVERNLALRMFAASRGVATADAQREFWLEFSWIDQEYRMAVRRLASFCREHRRLISSTASSTYV